MVRHAIARARLIELIAQERPKWIGRARARTAAYARAARYTGGSEFWGEIKNVYIRLQHEKCAYCETRLQGAVLASKVHEVEHFRPKQSVRAWPDPRLAYLSDFTPSCATGAASASATTSWPTTRSTTPSPAPAAIPPSSRTISRSAACATSPAAILRG